MAGASDPVLSPTKAQFGLQNRFASVELTMPRPLVSRLSQARRTPEPAVTAALFSAVLLMLSNAVLGCLSSSLTPTHPCHVSPSEG